MDSMEPTLSDNANSSSESDASPRTLIKRFHILQEERVETYKLFEEGFQAYLNGSPNYNFALYKRLVHEITDTFNRISLDIIALIEKFEREYKRVTLVNLLRKLQDAEREKLENTAKLQMTRQNIVDHPTDEEHKTQEIGLKHSMKELVEKLIELMDEIKYESEDVYDEDDEETTETDNVQVER